MKIEKLVAVGVIFFIFLIAIPAGAWVFVPPLGDTGWKTFTYNFESNFTGYAGFVVSNQGDALFDSWLLLDNLSHAGISDNKGFELGRYDGYTLVGNSNGEVTSYIVTAPSGNSYQPTEGRYMSYQQSNEGNTSSFINAFKMSGYNGSILETNISIKAGEAFSFNWAFITWDEPYNDPDWGPLGYDFALFYLKNESGGIIEIKGLAQVVPVPTTLILMGSGLLGIIGIGLGRRKGKK